MPVSASLLLQKRQRGEEFSASEMRWFVDSCVEMRPEVLGPEQASALLMAMSLSESNGGLTTQETVYMAQAIADSGAKVQLPDDEPSVSLYSGVGDKTSLIVVPVCASCGIKVPKISDRGFIGGIVDKLECIPGFRVKMPEQDFIQIVEEVNAAIVAPFPDIVPADEPLRRIRELLYISENLPLMAASVVGKKLAGGTSSFLFDVKTGSGTALADVNAAVSFAQKLVAAARGTERSASAFVTSMHQPLGYAIGSYLELVECLQILNGQHTRTGNLRDISFLLSAQVLLQAGKCSTLEEGYNMAVESITSGRAMESFRKMVEAQGGDLEFIAKALEPGPSPYTVERRIEVRVEPGDLEHIESELPVDSTIDDATRIVGIDTIVLGELSKKLGAFRSVASDNIDFGSGIELQRSLSEAVHPGDILCTLYTNNARTSDADLCKAARKAFSFERGPVSAQPLIFAFIDGEGGVTNL
ncbi:Thymidine phosphorylase [Hondaea fermentalgiana]|uniref:Thymidine phosphorylase n=1 Tax=Hondaea fermentalgiana TaxID=2315210 RepID=A0A2R5H3I0_9STRA|nr:Thymidine phosphorylase [Hondaea fermentalgiana]|eukprot:GBG34974.1 Thymidine phosphorylase [Hondaea fermentalgiana]